MVCHIPYIFAGIHACTNYIQKINVILKANYLILLEHIFSCV